MTQQLFDTVTGEVIPNIRTQRLLVTMVTTKTYPKVERAEIVIRAESPEDAWNYAATWIKLPLMEVASVETLPRS